MNVVLTIKVTTEFKTGLPIMGKMVLFGAMSSKGARGVMRS